MQYNTIVLELLQSNPELRASLLHNNSLTSIMNQYASQLRDRHLAIIQELEIEQPGISELMISSEAMEIAIQELRDAWTRESSPLSLDEAMNYIKRNTPPD